ncbi:unnamed protein product [Camellia sinensis]
MCLSFQLTTPLGHPFKPLHAFLKLTHETKVEHIFVLGNSGELFEITLMALLHGLVDNPYWCMEKNFNGNLYRLQ